MSNEITRVMLIDDDEAEKFLAAAILDQIPQSAFELDWVSTFEEGREALRKNEHDVYLVDYLLSPGSGIELVREARALQNRAPMILLTGKGRYEVDVQAMEAGVSDYLEKGNVSPDTMERSIRYAIDRARADTALRDSEERHRSLFDNLPNGLFRTTLDGALLDANPSLVQMLGRPDQDTLEFEYARNFFVSPSHRQSFLHRLEFGVVRAFESHLKRPDGSTVHVRTAARAFRTPDGVTQYVEGSVEDVTEERHAKDLHSRAARFAWVFDGSGLAILLLDLSGVIQDANPAFLKAFGFQASDLQGRELADCVDEGDREAVTKEVSRILEGVDTVSESRWKVRAADGRILLAQIRSGLVRTWDGHPDHIIVLFEDVAEA